MFNWIVFWYCAIAMIWLCVKRTSNVHKDRTQESRNTKNTYDFFVQLRNFLLPLSLKVLRHEERYTHSFYSGFFICPPSSRAAPAQGLREQAKVNPSRSVSSSQLNYLSSKFPKSSARFQCVTSFALASPVSYLGLWWHLWVTRPLRPLAREHLC